MKKARFTRKLHRRDAKARRRRGRKAAAALGIATGLLAATGGPAQAAFPGTNGMIVFDSFRDSNNLDVWALDPNAVNPPGSAVPVSQNTAPDFNPRWSPDGKQVAYVSRRGTDTAPQVYVQDVNAPLTAHRVTTQSSTINDSKPAWSPDMTEIAFAKISGGGRDIWVVNVTTGAERQITATATNLNPSWSANGSYIAFESNRSGGTFDIWKMPSHPVAPDAGATDLTPNTTTSNETQVDVSPGSGRILYKSDRAGVSPAGDVFVQPASATGTPTRLTTQQGNDPGFSPDGKKFTFASNRNVPGSVDVFVQPIAPDTNTGVTATNVSNNPAADQHPDWGVGMACPPPSSDLTLPPLPLDPSSPLPVADQDPAAGQSSDGGVVMPGVGSSQGAPPACAAPGGGSSDGGTGAATNGSNAS
jgi:TolB protein